MVKNDQIETKVVEKRDFGKEFEDEVRTFLKEKINLSDVNGGAGFYIGEAEEKVQIDACGRYKDVLFIFECKASGRKTEKSLRKDIQSSREKFRFILKNFKLVPEYKKFRIVRFIFITKKIEIPESEKDLLKNLDNPRLYYADEHLLEYYADLYGKVGEYAVFNFLAYFKIPPPPNEEIHLLATKTRIGKHTVFSFFARPNDLLRFSYVARRRTLKENFYQRMLEESRINRIKKFLDNGGMFPTNLILSLKGSEKTFKEIKTTEKLNGLQFGTLTIKDSYSACWIIDGQHRLYSFAKSTSNELVSCLAFSSLDVENERRFFLEINR